MSYWKVQCFYESTCCIHTEQCIESELQVYISMKIIEENLNPATCGRFLTSQHMVFVLENAMLGLLNWTLAFQSSQNANNATAL
jgi:cytoskeletal protein RodZ